MLLRFTKMHSLGMDFMLVDLVSQHAYVQPRFIKQWSERRTGVGFDRLVTVEVPSRPDVDFRCRVFTAQGLETTPCSQTLRCVIRFVADKRLTLKRRLLIETSQGVMLGHLRVDGLIDLELDVPTLQVKQNVAYATVTVMGKTHAVALLENPQALHSAEQVSQTFDADIQLVGALSVITQRTASHVCWAVNGQHELLYAESASASAVLAIHQQKLESPAYIECGYGQVVVEWQGPQQPVMLTGPAFRVYEGQIRL